MDRPPLCAVFVGSTNPWARVVLDTCTAHRQGAPLDVTWLSKADGSASTLGRGSADFKVLLACPAFARDAHVSEAAAVDIRDAGLAGHIIWHYVAVPN